VGILRRLMQLIRHFLPGAHIRVRLDGASRHPQLLAILDAEPESQYVVAMGKNAVLKAGARPNEPCAKPASFRERSGKTEQPLP